MTYSDRGVGRLSYGCPTPEVERVYPDRVLVLDGSKVPPITVRHTRNGKGWEVRAGSVQVYVTARRSAALREAKRVANARSRVVAVNASPLHDYPEDLEWSPAVGVDVPGATVWLDDDGQGVQVWARNPRTYVSWSLEDLERVLPILASAYNHLTTSHERNDENDSQ